MTIALLHVRGPVAERAILGWLKDLTPPFQTEVIWALEGWTLGLLLRRCRDAGLIAETPSDTDCDKVWYQHCGRYDESIFSLFFPFALLLAKAGGAVHFVKEHRQSPPRNDRLIRRFTRCCGPALSPRALTEVIDSRDDVRIGHTVQFVWNQKRYRLELPDYGRYYVPPLIVGMLNDALRDGGYDERFVAMFDEEQQVFVYGKPQLLREVSRQLFLPLVGERELVADAVDEYLRARKG